MRKPQLLVVTPFLCLVGLACSGGDFGKDVQRTLSHAAVDSLPRLEVQESPPLCVADGRNLCPLHSAIANWIDARRFVLWEPGAGIALRTTEDTSAILLGHQGGNPGEYTTAAAAGFVGGEYLVLDSWRSRVLHYRSDRSFRDESAIPQAPPGGAFGFIGGIPLYQRFRPSGPDSSSILEVRRVKAFGDTVGTVIFTVPVPSMRFREGAPMAMSSLFPTVPSYTLGSNGDAIWSAGDRVSVERRNAAGTVRWHTVMDIQPVQISPADIQQQVAEFKKMPGLDDEDLASIDSAAVHTAGVFPSVTGITLDHSGRVLLAGPMIPTKDSVEFFLLDRTGAPEGRFSLERHSQVLLLTGDSILVHRPTSSEPWEVRWLVVGKRH